MSRFEPRMIAETESEARISAVVEPVVEEHGFLLVRVNIFGGSKSTIQIMLERPEGGLNVGDCQYMTGKLVPVLDVEYAGSSYDLEVSSPGIGRPLVRRGDFIRCIGKEVKVSLSSAVDNRVRLRGTIIGFRDGKLGVRLKALDQDDIWFPEDVLEKASLVVTDEMLKAVLRADKRHRKRIHQKD